MTALPSPAQRRFLQFFERGSPDRAVWLKSGRRLSPVTDPHSAAPEATHILVYRLADGSGVTFPGEAIERRVLSVGELQALWSCWAEPLKSLNLRGVAMARSRPEKPRRVSSFRQTDEEREALERAARAAGVAPSSYVAEVLARHLEELTEQPKTAVAVYRKGAG